MHEAAVRMLLIGADDADEQVVRDCLAATKAPAPQLACARSLNAGRAAFREQAYNLYLVDCIHDEAGAREFLREAGEHVCGAPTLALIGSNTALCPQEALRLGATDVIERCQLTGPLLAQTIRSALRHAKLAAELAASRRLLQGTIDALDLPLALLDDAGRIEVTNARWRAGAAFMPALLPHHGTQAHAPAPLAPQEGLRTVVRGERQSFTLDYPAPHPTLETRWLRSRASRFTCSGQQQIVLSHEDITAQREAEASLRTSEARFRLLAENAQDVIYRYRLAPTPGFEYISPSCTALNGYTPEEHYADPNLLFRMIHPEERALLHEYFSREREDGQDIFRWVRKDGTVIWTEGRTRVIRDQDGQPFAIEGIVRDISARVAQEDALRASEEQYRTLVEQAADGIVLTDLHGTVIEANAAALALTGYTRDEFLGRNVAKIVPLASPARTPERAAALQAGHAVRSQRWLHHKDGSIRHVSVNVRRVDDDLIQGIWHDVTTQQEADTALRASEARFRAIFEDAAIGMALLSLERRVLACNAALEQLFGYSEEELRALPSKSGISDPRDEGDDRELYRALLAGERAHYQIEKRYVHKGGHTVWGRLTMSLVRGNHGEPHQIISMIEDVTRQRVAEEALHRQLNFSRAVTDNLASGLVMIDREGLITFANPMAHRLIGYADGTLPGRDIRQILPRWSTNEPFQRVLALPVSKSLPVLRVDEGQFVRPDKSTFPAGYTASAIVSDDKLTGMVLNFRDTTRQNQVNAELAAARRRLADVHAEAELALARELHDGALQQILGVSYRLDSLTRASADNPQLATALAETRAYLMEVVHQLRDHVARLRPAGLDDLGLSAALHGHVARLQREHPAELPTITLDLTDDELDLLPTSALCLFRVAQESLQNVLRHAHASTVHISVKMEGAETVLTIADDGRGFPVPSSLTAFTRDRHFGLIGMQERVAAVGGHLAVESSPGHGTMVRVRIAPQIGFDDLLGTTD